MFFSQFEAKVRHLLRDLFAPNQQYRLLPVRCIRMILVHLDVLQRELTRVGFSEVTQPSHAASHCRWFAGQCYDPITTFSSSSRSLKCSFVCIGA